jgi:hypothetical protein
MRDRCLYTSVFVTGPVPRAERPTRSGSVGLATATREAEHFRRDRPGASPGPVHETIATLSQISFQIRDRAALAA